MRTIEGNLYTREGMLPGRLHTGADGRITGITRLPADQVPDRLILPGFIDLHVHGGGGADLMEGADAARILSRTHARFGTTSLVATTVSAAHEDLKKVLTAIAPLCDTRHPQSARILGVHLEGPYLNRVKLGAQPDQIQHADASRIRELCALAPIRILTLAPEMLSNQALLQELSTAGIRLQIGHSNGSYEQGKRALEQGISGFTHLFNAMSGLHHREPGMVGAALAHAEYAEIIPDLLHVHPGAVLAALRSIPGLYGVSDATAATGMPDGTYLLGSHQVHKCMGGVRLKDGTLAGSCLTMDQALRNLVKIGLPLQTASDCLSLRPARYLGLTDRGQLAAGMMADLVVLDNDLKIRQVWVEGENIELTA